MSRNNPGATLPREALEPRLRQRLLMSLARLSGNRASPRALIKSAWFVPFFAVIAVLFVWPLIMLMVGAFRSSAPFLPGEWTLAAWQVAFHNPGMLAAIWASVKIAVVSTVASLFFAIALAFISERTDLWIRRWIMPCMLLVFVTPGIFYAIAFTQLANPWTGLLNDALRYGLGVESPWLNVQGWLGIYTVLILKKVALTYLFIVGAFRALDSSHDEASYLSGAGPFRTFLSINLPSLAPALTSVALLGIIAGLQVFEPILILGGPDNIVVMATLLLNLVGGGAGPADYAQASILSSLFVAFIALIYMGQLRVLGRKGYVSVSGKFSRARLLRLRGFRSLICVLVLLFLVLSFVLPLGALAFSSIQPYPGVYSDLSLARYISVLEQPRVIEAIRVTLVLGVIVGAVVMTLAFSVATLSRQLGRRSQAALRFATLIPLAMPGVVTTVAISWAWLSIPAFAQLYGSIWLVALALIVTAMPFASQIALSATSQIAPSLSEAARMSGAGPVQTFFEIVLALAAPSFIAGWFMSALMVSGNLEVPLLLKSPGVNTLAVITYNLQSAGDYSMAAALLMVLMAFSVFLWGASLLTLWIFRRARHLNNHRNKQRALALAAGTTGGL